VERGEEDPIIEYISVIDINQEQLIAKIDLRAPLGVKNRPVK
jgi:hypothetical protein